VLGSRSARRAVHGDVRGMYEVDAPPVLAAHLDQGRLRGTDRRVSGFTGHGGTAEELRPEVLDGDGVMVADDLLGPLAGGVLPLPGDLRVRLGAALLRLSAALRSGLPFFGLRRAVIRSYRVGFACAFRPCCGWGRSWASDVVVAVSSTPRSTPSTRPVAGSRWASAATTNDAYQCPTASPYTRTDEGADGSSRDHTTVRAMPPARRRRPSFRRNPRVVQFRVGSAPRFFLCRGMPARCRIGRRFSVSFRALERDLAKSRMICCCGTEAPSRSHGARARASVSILSSRAARQFIAGGGFPLSR
jgi:hypothetical protein